MTNQPTNQSTNRYVQMFRNLSDCCTNKFQYSSDFIYKFHQNICSKEIIKEFYFIACKYPRIVGRKYGNSFLCWENLNFSSILLTLTGGGGCH